MKKINSFSRLFIVAALCFACGFQAMAQPATSRSFIRTDNEDYDVENMIVRAWTSTLSVVYQKSNPSYSGAAGFFSIVSTNDLNSTVGWFSSPRSVETKCEITDMEILGNELYFCGMIGNDAVIGTLDLNSLYTGSGMVLHDAYVLPLLCNANIPYPQLCKPLELKKMEVFKSNELHVVAVGETYDCSNAPQKVNVAVDFIIAPYQKVFYYVDDDQLFVEPDRSLSYDDIVVTDKFVTIVGRIREGKQDPFAMTFMKPAGPGESVFQPEAPGTPHYHPFSIIPSCWGPIGTPDFHSRYIDNVTAAALSPVQAVHYKKNDILFVTQAFRDANPAAPEQGYSVDLLRVGIDPSMTVYDQIISEMFLELFSGAPQHLTELRKTHSGYSLLFDVWNFSCYFNEPTMLPSSIPGYYSFIYTQNKLFSIEGIGPSSGNRILWVGKIPNYYSLIGGSMGVNAASTCYDVLNRNFYKHNTFKLFQEKAMLWYSESSVTKLVLNPFISTKYTKEYCVYNQVPGIVFSGSVGIENVEGESQVEMMPNPASSQVTISSTEEIISIEVYDLSGKKVFEQNCESDEVQLDVSNWAKGVYSVQANTLSGTTSKKLIVQ